MTATFLVDIADALSSQEEISNIGVFVANLTGDGVAEDRYLSGLRFIAQIAESASALDLITQRLLWEPEPIIPETWTDAGTSTTTWTTQSADSRSWTIISDNTDTWTPIGAMSKDWTTQ
jgi:hypothetical protein